MIELLAQNHFCNLKKTLEAVRRVEEAVVFGEGVLYNAGLATARRGGSGCVSASEVKKASRGPRPLCSIARAQRV